MFILSVFRHLVAQSPYSHFLRGAFAFLGQCVCELSSCDIVPLAWLAISNNKERAKNVCLMYAGQPKQLFIFLLDNFLDGESTVFTWGINFRRCGIHTHNLVFSLCCQPVLLDACIACPWVIRNLLITLFDIDNVKNQGSIFDGVKSQQDISDNVPIRSENIKIWSLTETNIQINKPSIYPFILQTAMQGHRDVGIHPCMDGQSISFQCKI